MCRFVSLAFVFTHVALLSLIISMATNFWFIDAHDSQHGGQLTNSTSCHKGLFEICCPGNECKYGAEFVYQTKEVQTYYRVSQFLFGFCGLSCLMAIVLFYTSLMSKKCYSSVCVSGWISSELIIAGLEGVTALCLLGANQKSDKGFPESVESQIGWSMYVAMGAVVAVFVALFANVLHNCQLHRENRQVQYERV